METNIKNANTSILLEEGFETHLEDIKDYKMSAFEKARSDLSYLEGRYSLLAKGVNLSDLNDIERLNSISNLISKLRVSFTIYEAAHNLNSQNHNEFIEDENLKLENFYNIFDQIEEIMNSKGKTL